MQRGQLIAPGLLLFLFFNVVVRVPGSRKPLLSLPTSGWNRSLVPSLDHRPFQLLTYNHLLRSTPSITDITTFDISLYITSTIVVFGFYSAASLAFMVANHSSSSINFCRMARKSKVQRKPIQWIWNLEKWMEVIWKKEAGTQMHFKIKRDMYGTNTMVFHTFRMHGVFMWEEGREIIRCDQSYRLHTFFFFFFYIFPLKNHLYRLKIDLMRYKWTKFQLQTLSLECLVILIIKIKLLDEFGI